jgi:hypothetical protein
MCLGLLFHAWAQDHASEGDTVDAHTTWRNYGGSPDGSQYSALRQINRSNVKDLQVAWTYRTGDDRKYAFNPTRRTQIQPSSPIAELTIGRAPIDPIGACFFRFATSSRSWMPVPASPF